VKRDYHGSCHCGAVKYRAAIDLDAGTVRCNCSICSKGRFWLAAVSPDDFELEQGEAALSTYLFGPHNIEHRFCTTCGVKPFGHSAQGGGFYAISVATLDDASPEELAAPPVAYVDGRADAFDRPPAVTSYL
jgi:hypothetical protein